MIIYPAVIPTPVIRTGAIPLMITITSTTKSGPFSISFSIMITVSIPIPFKPAKQKSIFKKYQI